MTDLSLLSQVVFFSHLWFEIYLNVTLSIPKRFPMVNAWAEMIGKGLMSCHSIMHSCDMGVSIKWLVGKDLMCHHSVIYSYDMDISIKVLVGKGLMCHQSVMHSYDMDVSIKGLHTMGRPDL